MKSLKIISAVIVFVLLLDVLGFATWLLSGQTPPSWFYVGSITAHIIGLIL